MRSLRTIVAAVALSASALAFPVVASAQAYGDHHNQPSVLGAHGQASVLGLHDRATASLVPQELPAGTSATTALLDGFGAALLVGSAGVFVVRRRVRVAAAA
jgi:hypothetical protein